MTTTTSTATGAWWREPTRAQWAAFIAAWSGWVLDAFDFTIFFLVMKEIGDEFGVSTLATTGSIALTLVARLAGGFVAGAVADRWGRRLPLLLSILGFSVCDGLCAAAPSFAFILVMRTLFGFFMGAEWTAGTTLAMESWPERSRHIASGILQGSWAIGYLLAVPVYGWVVPEYGWRGLFVVAAVPALLILPIRFFVKESPEFERQREKAPPTPMRELVKIPGWLGTIGWSTLVMACGFGVYYGLSALYPTIVKSVLHREDLLQLLLVLFNVGMMIGSVVTGWVAGRYGVLRAIVVPALLMLPAMPLYVGWVGGDVGLALGAFFAGALGVGYVGVTPLLLTSIFPAAGRARSIGLVYHLGAFPAAFVSTAIAALGQGTGDFVASFAIVNGGLLVMLTLAIVAARRRVLPPSLAPAPAAPADDDAEPEAVAAPARAASEASA